jgi:hypothetical protein
LRALDDFFLRRGCPGLPNPAPEAETARSLEAGIQVRSQRLGADRFGYVTDLRDF